VFEVAVTSSGSCLKTGFGISGVKHSGYANGELAETVTIMRPTQVIRDKKKKKKS
jgi:hypothetical protein